MSIDPESILQEALRLPTHERAAVAARLLASLDQAPPGDPAAVSAAWAEELERRARRALSGEDACEPSDELRDRSLRKLAR